MMARRRPERPGAGSSGPGSPPAARCRRRTRRARTHVGAREVEVVAQEIGKRGARLHPRPRAPALTVRRTLRFMPPVRSARARPSIRSASTAATRRRYSRSRGDRRRDRSAAAARAASSSRDLVGSCPVNAASPPRRAPASPHAEERQARSRDCTAGPAPEQRGGSHQGEAPWRRATSAKPQPASGRGSVKRTSVTSSSARSAVVNGARYRSPARITRSPSDPARDDGAVQAQQQGRQLGGRVRVGDCSRRRSSGPDGHVTHPAERLRDQRTDVAAHRSASAGA